MPPTTAVSSGRPPILYKLHRLDMLMNTLDFAQRQVTCYKCSNWMLGCVIPDAVHRSKTKALLV